jgi:hypothetical protein
MSYPLTFGFSQRIRTMTTTTYDGFRLVCSNTESGMVIVYDGLPGVFFLQLRPHVFIFLIFNGLATRFELFKYFF